MTGARDAFASALLTDLQSGKGERDTGADLGAIARTVRAKLPLAGVPEATLEAAEPALLNALRAR
jgi:hypothetical protein